MESTRAVVFDVGSDSIRAGHAGEDGPTCTMPTLVKMVHHGSTVHPTAGFVGSDTPVDAPTVRPVRNGVITQWDAMEWLWERAFRQLNVPSERHAVLLSDPPLSPRTQREKFAEVMFETFCVPGLYVENQSVLSVYSSGRTSGLVVESGTGCSYATPVHEGFYLPSNTCRVDYAGNRLDRHLCTLLHEAGTLIPEDDNRVAADIKEKCFVSPDIHTERLKIDNPLEHVLPDGRKIRLGPERFLVPEALFRPSAMGSREPGLATLVMNCLNMCEVGVKQALRAHVLLCGGSTLFRGLPERLQSELERVGGLGGGAGVRVVATEERKNAVWIGGSILAALTSFQSMWMRREEYLEKGPCAVYRAFI